MEAPTDLALMEVSKPGPINTADQTKRHKPVNTHTHPTVHDFKMMSTDCQITHTSSCTSSSLTTDKKATAQGFSTFQDLEPHSPFLIDSRAETSW
jgi:hypothetical protein